MNQKDSFLANLLRKYRAEHRPKWSQEKMANRLGISIKTYRKMERGELEFIPLSALLLVINDSDMEKYGIEKGEKHEDIPCTNKKTDFEGP